MATEVVQLRCAVQSYAWGKLGSDSAVAQLSQNDPAFVLQEDKPYAELWMGTHPNGPSTVCGPNNQSLEEWIACHDGCLGEKVSRIFNGRLPFLFKVLSVNKSLSIQAHPNKQHAAKLHSERPDIYKDPNHKPEMAIALTEYEGLCGFRPISEIKKFLEGIPELAAVIGEGPASFLASTDSNSEEGLKACFSALMKCNADQVEQQLNKLVIRIHSLQHSGKETTHCLGDLLLRLNSQFRGDVGCFCIYFLNHITLQPGQAMFLGPNLPHAYLSGDCMECMACSDNVVRAGLTPKYKDVQTLCEMLQYKPGTPEENIFQPVPDTRDSCVLLYDPPVEDFSVSRIKVPSGCTEYTVRTLGGPSILIVIYGQAVVHASTEPIRLQRGTVLFIPANGKLALDSQGQEILAFRAYSDPS